MLKCRGAGKNRKVWERFSGGRGERVFIWPLSKGEGCSNERHVGEMRRDDAGD